MKGLFLIGPSMVFIYFAVFKLFIEEIGRYFDYRYTVYSNRSRDISMAIL